MTPPPLRVGLVCDLAEESWPSMDLVAERLDHHLRTDHASTIAVTRLCPPLVPRLSRVPGVAPRGIGWTADRLLNRYLDYPRWLRGERVAARFDLLHVVDHSYAHLVHGLPARRSVVTCHDLDAFQAVIDPLASRRSPLLRPMARYTLDGLAAAARVVCDSRAVRDELLAHRLVRADRVVVIPNGVHPSRSADPAAAADAAATALLGEPSSEAPELLHVGSTIPRKRIDRLFRVFAGVTQATPGARLVRVGVRSRPRSTPWRPSWGSRRASARSPFWSSRCSRPSTGGRRCCCSPPMPKGLGCRWSRRWAPVPRCRDRPAGAAGGRGRGGQLLPGRRPPALGRDDRRSAAGACSGARRLDQATRDRSRSRRPVFVADVHRRDGPGLREAARE